MNKAEKVKKQIKDKFRTMKRFALIAGLNAMGVRKILNGDPDSDDIDKLSNLCEKLKDKSLPGEMNAYTRNALIRKISEYGGVLEFCKKNPQFPLSTVYRVMSGDVKKMDNKAFELIKHFNL